MDSWSSLTLQPENIVMVFNWILIIVLTEKLFFEMENDMEM